MEQFLNEYSYELEGAFRLLLAAVLAGIMGLERTRKHREAGFRTYMLVALGSAMTVLVGEIMFFSYGSADTTRIAASAATGVGFIGAGSIIVSRANRVKGLTTAAGIWVSMAVGLAVGSGYYIGGVALVVISVGAVMLGEKLQSWFLGHSGSMRLSIIFSGEEFVLPFIALVKENGYTISSLDVERPLSCCVSATMLLHLPEKRPHDEVIDFLQTIEGVLIIEDI